MPTDLNEVFSNIYRNNGWDSPESVSGIGSTIAWTRQVSDLLPRIIKEYSIKRMLDAGCGDLNWIPLDAIHKLGCKYEGCDIVFDLVAEVKKRISHVHLFTADITKDPFHAYDLILCRTVLFHLSFENCARGLENFRRSGSTLLLMTTHPHIAHNSDIIDGSWRRINFTIEPFNLPAPIEMWKDGPGDDGYLGLWNLKS